MNISLIITLSLDLLFACMAYGFKNIRIPAASKAVIVLVSTAFLAFSMTLGGILSYLLPEHLLKPVGFAVLFLMGLLSLFESMIKQVLKRHRSSKTIRLKYSDIAFVVDIYIDKTKADADHSQTLSPREAFFLALPLSIDSLFTGLSISANTPEVLLLLLLSAISGYLAAALGARIGQKSSLHKDYTWLSGLILIALAFGKLFF